MRISDWSSDVFSSDLNTHHVVVDPKRLFAFGRHGEMRHGGGMARQRFGATQADGQFCDFQRVKESERFFLSALQIEGKGRSCTFAVSLVYIPLPVVFGKIGRASCRERVCQIV